MNPELKSVRSQFPSLKRRINGNPIIYLDGPGGTQVPERVIRAIGNYYRRSNTNIHGHFKTSRETDAIILDARRHVAALLGAEGPETISIGANMTSLTYSLAHGYSRILNRGEEVLITQLDHEANRGPWVMLKDHGIKVQEVKLLPEGILDYDDFARKLNKNTKLVAVGLASNALGTVNDISRIRELSHEVGAHLVIDAVHYVPHFSINVRSLGCDFLLCSAYKFYGPHVGLLYSKPGLLDQLPTDRLITTDQQAPYRIETGTLNHASIRGVTEAIEFIASLGLGSGETLRDRLADAYKSIGKHEFQLGKKLFEGLSGIRNVQVIGQDFTGPQRAPTVSFTSKTLRPEQICRKLGDQNIHAWDGHFYAIRAMEVLGLLESGGVTRLGISVYSTKQEMDLTLEAIDEIA